MCVCSPAGAADSQEHAEVAVQDDSQGQEEDETAKHERVALIGWRGGHIVPRA